MELNQSSLRGILAQILSVDQKYIVPKQGNWWNPQEQGSAPVTWCAYMIRRNRPRTVPTYVAESQLSGDVNYVRVTKIADIDLQFVGTQAEELAQSVCLWTRRSDVQAQFATVQGAVMNCAGDALSSYFGQDGGNAVMAWNVSIQVLWESMTATTQGPMPLVDLQG